MMDGNEIYVRTPAFFLGQFLGIANQFEEIVALLGHSIFSEVNL